MRCFVGGAAETIDRRIDQRKPRRQNAGIRCLYTGRIIRRYRQRHGPGSAKLMLLARAINLDVGRLPSLAKMP